MKEKEKKREQFLIAEALFEMGMDFNVISDVCGITPLELLMKRANIIDLSDDLVNNNEVKINKSAYQEPRKEGTNNRGSNPK